MVIPEGLEPPTPLLRRQVLYPVELRDHARSAGVDCYSVGEARRRMLRGKVEVKGEGMRSQCHACSSGAMGAGFHGQKSANQPGQVYEALKDCVRAKVFWRNSGVAEPNGKDRDPCASGGGDVSLAVADHDRERQYSARSQDKFRDVARVGAELPSAA